MSKPLNIFNRNETQETNCIYTCISSPCRIGTRRTHRHSDSLCLFKLSNQCMSFVNNPNNTPIYTIVSVCPLTSIALLKKETLTPETSHLFLEVLWFLILQSEVLTQLSQNVGVLFTSFNNIYISFLLCSFVTCIFTQSMRYIHLYPYLYLNLYMYL